MFRVAMISPLPPQRTGESSYTAKLIESIVSHSDTEIVAISGTDAHPLVVKGEEIETLNVWRGGDVLYPFRLLRVIKRLRPHIVHVQFGPHGEVYGGSYGERMLLLLILLRLAGVRTTVTSHSTWMPDQVRKRVSTYKRLGRFSILAKPLFRLYMKLLDWGTTSIQLSTVTEDSTLKEQFLHEYSADAEKVLEISHPCETRLDGIDQKQAKTRIGIAKQNIILLFGFIRPDKGIDVAIKAMRELTKMNSEVILLIAGSALEKRDEEHLDYLNELVKKLELEENVRFDNEFIPERQVSHYFAAASIILLPYAESVGASGPAHRYASYGIPMIASDIGYHLPEALGGNLVLFREESHRDLAERLKYLLADKEEAARIGARLRAYAASESWDKAAKRTLRNYRTTLRL